MVKEELKQLFGLQQSDGYVKLNRLLRPTRRKMNPVHIDAIFLIYIDGFLGPLE